MLMRDVVIIVPVYRNYLEDFEKVSISMNCRKLKDFDIRFVSPDSLKYDKAFTEIVNDYEVEAVYFDDIFFKGIAGYNKLMLHLDFYKNFSNYEYILICQLDALILKGDIINWLSKSYDYIGAPWIVENRSSCHFDGMGNGGLSLRKVSKFIEVLESENLYFTSCKYNSLPVRSGRKNLLILRLIYGLEKVGLSFKFIDVFLRLFRSNEDYFWAFFAKFFVPDFNLPNPIIALQFSFEVNPRKSYLCNNKQLPFGCHAWQKYDREFWEELLPELIEDKF